MPSASPVTGWKSGGNRTSRSASRRATADGAEAVAQSLRHRPDVVLMDIRMPGMDGLEATRRILAIAASPQPSRWQSFSTYGQFARIDAEVITQGGIPFVRDAQRPPAADGDDPRAGKEMPVQGRTDRASQMRPALGEVKARQHQRPATGPGGSQIDADRKSVV